MKSLSYFCGIAALILALTAATVVLSSPAKGKNQKAAKAVSATQTKSGMIVPPFLSPGDKIAIITPSYATTDAKIKKALEIVRSWGYEPVLGPNVGKRFAKEYAGTVEERLSDIRWALKSPDIKAILCQRGGYGALHFVGMISPEEFREHPKWLIGYSDITTLLSMECCAGVLSIHGPMGNYMAFYDGKDTATLMLRDLLGGKIPSYTLPAHRDNICGKATGRLVGGNICTMAPVAGTDVDFTAEGDLILFIEEVEEGYHNIDRQLNILLKHGIIDRVKGVILGDFTDCKADLDYRSAEALVASYFKGKGIPVCCGFPAGHGDWNWPLIIGADVTLTVNPEGSTLSFKL
ncbi:MAG: LD-carboxypeptidase [Bacteroidales bacterium]|nr:LD-carboxypeptidase [Bacteroidales bacterium]